MASKINEQVVRQVNRLFGELARCTKFSGNPNKILSPVEELLMKGAPEDAARQLLTQQIAKYRQ